MKLEYFLTPYTKIKQIKDLIVRPIYICLTEDLYIITETITLRGKQTEHSDINHSKILYDPPLRIMDIKASGT